MRKTEGSLESLVSEFNELDNPFIAKKTEHNRKRKRKCIMIVWLMSNILTFTAGYYIKYRYFDGNCLLNDGGSM